ncbi:MAG: hypothetical protein HY081_12095 [Gammaproteobacteria bacterium]|nr:hypothetical protein [Gammaproteobacteria bacterium]
MMAVATLVGFLGTLAAQENVELAPNQDAANQNVTEQKPLLEASTALATAPTPAPTSPTENLLTKMKVYPSF